MPTLLRLDAGRVVAAEDRWTTVADETPVPEGDGPVVVPLSRLAEVEARPLGVRLRSDEAVEALAYDLPRLSLVALEFPKFRDGRAFTAAQLLRTRYGFTGEVRAVGDVGREQAGFMARCGFDAFEPADGSTVEDWQAALERHRHVYAAAADGRTPAFVDRAR